MLGILEEARALIDSGQPEIFIHPSVAEYAALHTIAHLLAPLYGCLFSHSRWLVAIIITALYTYQCSDTVMGLVREREQQQMWKLLTIACKCKALVTILTGGSPKCNKLKLITATNETNENCFNIPADQFHYSS